MFKGYGSSLWPLISSGIEVSRVMGVARIKSLLVIFTAKKSTSIWSHVEVDERFVN